MSLSKKHILPVVQSFRRHLDTVEPKSKAAKIMGPEAWNMQRDIATKDFENYLQRTVNRIIGRLERGGYAPTSAMNPRRRPLDDKPKTDDQE